MEELKMNEQMTLHAKGKELNLNDLKSALFKRKIMIFVITMFFTLLSALYSFYTFYTVNEASTRILVKASPETMETLLVMMDEPVVLRKVVEDLNLSMSPETLSNKISVSTVNESQVVKITVSDRDPVLAAKIANKTAEAYQSEIPQLFGFNNFKLLSTADEHSSKSYINFDLFKNLFLGIILGLFISIGIVFILDSLDQTFKTETEVENILGIPVVGSISSFKSKQFRTSNRRG
ncbi:YveK family protein [Pseudalkalibacillus sp. SCS-8]|uniref:YveK family protein n=1 Tax=Pseudalkalibacillus nanhaiensis TaxID=3115291 RepID=UPI0032DAD8EE